VNWTRTGFLRIVRRMRGIVLGDLEQEGTELLAEEPVSDLDVATGPSRAPPSPRGGPLAIDELPLVALLGCFAEGETSSRGPGAPPEGVRPYRRRRRVPRRARADIEASADGFRVRGGEHLRGGVIDSRGDHRLAMMGAIAGLASREGVEVRGMDAAAVSYPGFVEDLGAVCP